jgi:hypothetical protein
MEAAYRQQLKQIVSNLHESKGTIPYVSDLSEHPLFGPAIKTLSYDDKKEVSELINNYVSSYVSALSTKGGELFKRLYEQYTDEFWEYRVLNQDRNNIHLPRFQKISELFQKELFELESVLTSKMLKRPE